MGVGVYSSDFNGTGGTILVSGPLGDEKDYEEYKKNRPSDEDFMSYDEWNQDQYNIFNEMLVEALEQIGRELGFSVNNRRGFRADRARFDGDFVGIASGDALEIGWRSWEHDFVVGIGGCSTLAELMQDAEGNKEQIIEETSRPYQRAESLFSQLSAKVQEYVRLRLMDDNFECRFKTSGYTSSQYTMPDDAKNRLETLKAEIAQVSGQLFAPMDQALQEATASDRVNLVKSLFEINQDYGFNNCNRAPFDTVVPVYDAIRNMILMASPYEVPGWLSAIRVPAELRDYVKTLETTENFAPLPRNEVTETWFQHQQSRTNKWLIVSADEFIAGVQEDLVIQTDGEKNEPDAEYVIARAPVAPSPTL